MRFQIIDPKARTITPFDADDLDAAKRAAGLKPMETDIGNVVRAGEDGGLGVVVYEYGLFVPPDRQHYFALGTRLYAGNAVIFAYDAAGETVDCIALPAPRWFSCAEEVELAIIAGVVIRPQIAVNGAVLWRWPQAAPNGMGA